MTTDADAVIDDPRERAPRPDRDQRMRPGPRRPGADDGLDHLPLMDWRRFGAGRSEG